MTEIIKQRISVSTSIDQPVRLAFRATEDAFESNTNEINREITRLDTELAAAIDDLNDPATDVAAGLIALATQEEVEAATDVSKALTPGRVHFHPGVAKFWAFVTVTSGTHALAASYNVTSITDGNTGLHTVTIATDFSSANWACAVSASGSSSSAADARFASLSGKTATSITVSTCTVSTTPVLADAVSVTTIGYGDHA